METVIINKKTAQKSQAIRQGRKKAQRYYAEKYFGRNNGEPRTKIGKIADITNIDFVNLTDEKKETTGKTIYSKEELVEACKMQHITGRSGNGFSTAIKLESYHATKGILLINGVECDPGLFHDAWIYRNKLDDVVKGMEFLNTLYDFDRMIIATKEPVYREYTGIEQVKVRDRFPMGYEKSLIKTILETDLGTTRPTDKGILVLNIQTVLAVAELAQGKAAGNERFITFVDIENAKATVVKTQIGESVKAIAKELAPTNSNPVYVGGGAMSCHPSFPDEKIMAETCFVAIGKATDYDNSHKCVGCGKCTRNCPASIKINKIVQEYEKSGKVNSGKYDTQACIGCGACTYFCAGGKDLRSIIASNRKG